MKNGLPKADSTNIKHNAKAEIIAYAYRDGLKKITESDAKILTHVNIAFGLIGTDGRLRTDCLKHMDAVAQIRRWNPDIRIILSIGG